MDTPEAIANPTPQQETNYHLDRIASALEGMAETQRLSYELSIDSLAKSNELTDNLSHGLSGLLGGLGFETETPDDET